jgi:hypothetical protein
MIVIKTHEPQPSIYTTDSRSPMSVPGQQTDSPTGVQPEKTVGNIPTVVTDRKEHKSSNKQSTSNGIIDPKIPAKRMYKFSTTIDNYTTKLLATIQTPNTHDRQKLAMSTPDPPTGSGPSRRRVQRFKRGGHHQQLGTQARSTIS